jgi:hypothetical protein
MRRLALNSVTLATLFVGVLYAVPAQAQASRTWVSGVGDDANPCSRTAPCKTFAGAISKTAAGGEINVLDPGGYGGVTITKAITISSEGFEAGIIGTGIVVNAPSGVDVILKGLDLEGLGIVANGINILSQSTVVVINCRIHHYTANGINLNGPGSARVVVKDSFINLAPTGVNIAATGNQGVVLNTTIDETASQSINVAAGATLYLGESRLIGSFVNVTNAGNFVSFGDNVIQLSGTPSSTTNLK